jgi:hypothetical protein
MRRRGERGETLAEVLVSTALLGIIGIGIIGAIASVLISTDIDRRVSAGETVLRSYVAAIEDADYSPCAGAHAFDPGAIGYTQPANFEAVVTRTQFWVGAPDGPVVVPRSNAQLTFSDACPSPDHGLQRIDIEVHSLGTRPTTERVTIYKRRTTAPAP